jgi:tetraacyldisaccharide 4'-kinase
VWITHAELAEPGRVGRLREWIDRHAPGVPVVVTEHRATGLRPLGERAEPPAPGETVIALSGLGNPESFEQALTALGYRVEPLRFADHHRYAPADWGLACAAAAAAEARHVITTEKDAVKLPPPPAGAPPVWVLGCELIVVDGQPAVDALIKAARSWPPERSTPSAAP